MSIHQRIRERRIALGMGSHKALADLLDVSWQTVQLWEKEGGTAPNRNRIKRVAEVLGVTPNWLQHGDIAALEKTGASGPEVVAPLPDEIKRHWLNGEEADHLADFRSLTEKNRRRLRSIARGMERDEPSIDVTDKL